MDTEASSTIETATVSQAGVPSCADQRRTGIAFSCLLGAFCGLYLDYVLKNGASMGPTPAIFYWLLFIIASGRNAFKGGWFSKESLWSLLPPLVVIVTFVAPPLLMTIASGSFSPMWTLALSLFSVLILVFTPQRRRKERPRGASCARSPLVSSTFPPSRNRFSRAGPVLAQPQLSTKGQHPNTDKIGSRGPRNHTPIF